MLKQVCSVSVVAITRGYLVAPRSGPQSQASPKISFIQDSNGGNCDTLPCVLITKTEHQGLLKWRKRELSHGSVNVLIYHTRSLRIRSPTQIIVLENRIPSLGTAATIAGSAE